MTYIGAARRACAAGVALVAPLLLCSCVSTVSGTAVRGQSAGPLETPPLDASKLDDVLLSIGEVNGIMGSSTMKVTSDLDDMTDHSDQVSDARCLGAIYGAEKPVYAGSGWTDMRDQVAREPEDDNKHWVEQTAVLYPSAAQAEQFFNDSKTAWKSCANSSVAVTDSGSSYSWSIADVTTKDSMITQMTTQQDAGGWGCQHALAAASNLALETWACGYSVKDEAAAIATAMIANAAKK